MGSRPKAAFENSVSYEIEVGVFEQSAKVIGSLAGV